MKGDFSRATFDVTKHFSRVLMQQGRVQVDADWNEQTAILLHYLQSLAKDLIGDHGGPSDIEDKVKNIVLKKNLGFEIIVDPKRIEQFSELSGSQITELKSLLSQSKPPILIGKGHYYVEGILCEVDNYLSFAKQPDYPWEKDKDLEKGNYLVYVDVWERHLTYIEDDYIREVALGDADTATRARIVWQVKTEHRLQDDTDIPDKIDGSWRDWVNQRWSAWTNKWQPTNRGMLKAQAKQDQKKDTDPCITSPEASYRGLENQLYRVEIHNGGIAWDGKTSTKDNAASFKWSRDNGSTVTGIKLDGTEMTVNNPRGLLVGQWLELTNDGQELRGEPGTLAKIKKIESDLVFLDIANSPMPRAVLPDGETWPTKARLWERNEVPIIENDNDIDWIKLEDGVQIQFQPSVPENQYRTGDYWLIPARVATGDVEWPGDVGKPEALTPHGIDHHYAPLTIINLKDGGTKLLQDLRWHIEPLGKPMP